MPNPPRSPFDELTSRFMDEVLLPFLEDQFDQVAARLAKGPAQITPPRGQKRARTNRPAPRPSHKAGSTMHARGPYQPTLYQILQVDGHADVETIRAAYLSLSRRYHPDVNKSKEAVDRMKQINVAWEVLRDKGKRQEYDRRLRED